MIVVALAGMATIAATVTGTWDCATTNVVTAFLRTQTGENSISEMAPAEFKYSDFSFSFEGGTALVRLRIGEERKEQRVPYFQQGNYVTFNFNQGLSETGWASPLTIWTNEASSSKARYEVSFPTASMRTRKNMDGAEAHLGDAAMAVAALSCQKRSS